MKGRAAAGSIEEAEKEEEEPGRAHSSGVEGL